MDRGDDRLLVAEDAHGLHIEMVDRQLRGRILLRTRLLLLPGRIAEIGAGAESLALCREHRAADFDVAVEFLQRIRDLVDQGYVEEVERGPPDFDQTDMAMLLDADISVVAHALSPINRTSLRRPANVTSPTGRGRRERQVRNWIPPRPGVPSHDLQSAMLCIASSTSTSLHSAEVGAGGCGAISGPINASAGQARAR